MPVERFRNLPLRIWWKLFTGMCHIIYTPVQKSLRKLLGETAGQWVLLAAMNHRKWTLKKSLLSWKLGAEECVCTAGNCCLNSNNKKNHAAGTWPWASRVHCRNLTLEKTAVPQKLPRGHWDQKERPFTPEREGRSRDKASSSASCERKNSWRAQTYFYWAD